MRVAILLLVLATVCGSVLAEKPQRDPPIQPNPIPCGLETVAIVWDFSQGPMDCYTEVCQSGGKPCWEWGPPAWIPDPPDNAWGTIISGNYPDSAGQRLVTPLFAVTEGSFLVEVTHYFDMETDYDGGNVVVGGQVEDQRIYPLGDGYTTDSLSTSLSYNPFCVNMEPAWTGQTPTWRTDCFDLSPFLGDTVDIGFDFGSDRSVTRLGWYIHQIRVGGPVPLGGVCCDPYTGNCSIVMEEVCIDAGGEWLPQFYSCVPNPCPPGPFFGVGELINPEPWHNFIGPSSQPLALQLYWPNQAQDPIDYVSFFFSTNNGHTWLYIGEDTDGSEPILDTYGTSQPQGDGWSVDWTVPDGLPPGEMLIRASASTLLRSSIDQNFPANYDPAPPQGARSTIEDVVIVTDDTLGVPVDEGDTDVDWIYVHRLQTEEYFSKGIPGIEQNYHSPTSCGPASAAQCLKYFEGQGDSEITDGLGNVPLLYALAQEMRTNIDTIGTSYSNWINGTRSWVQDHGDGYTVRGFKHYNEAGYSTWTQADWVRIRDELIRCHDVLLGIYWVGGGGHAVTLDAISHELEGSSHIIDFRDPWTGLLEYAEIDTASGWLSGVTGAGGGSDAFIGSTMIVAPRQQYVWDGHPGDLVYSGPFPHDPPHIIEVGFPDLSYYLLQFTFVNNLGHAYTQTAVVDHTIPGSIDLLDHGPLAFRLGRCLPSPFRGTTDLSFTVPHAIPVRIEIFDISGRSIRTLFDGSAEPGSHHLVWNGEDDGGRAAPAGIYYVKMSAGTFERARSVILLR